jgi:putative transposase
MSRTVYVYKSRARDSSMLLMRIREIAATRVHYDYRRVHVMLQREGFKDNHKRVYRLYREEGLSLRLKRPKRNKSARLRQPKHEVTAINQIWSMDFVADALFDGRRLRALTIVDNYTRESLAIEVGQSLKGEDVVNTLNDIAMKRGLPATIKVDRAGTGNLNKALSGESATFDCPTGRGNGAEDGKKNETDALSGVQSKSSVSGLGGRQDAGRAGTAI